MRERGPGSREPGFWKLTVERRKPPSIPICFLAGEEGGGHVSDILVLAL